ncbi:MAG TPA: helix-turn-helix domain-containing protein [Miltoncostaeaceae bacterium]|nr:helix-turn-helix domain-containing protein [Miltoncostaeaceae bacterium]
MDSSRSGPRHVENDWLSISAAARALGVSSSTLRLWASEGRIPHVRTAGGHRRFDPETLREWLVHQPVRDTRPTRRAVARLERAPEIAAVLRARVEDITELVMEVVEGPAEAAFHRLTPHERVAAVRGWIDLLADAFVSGSLAEGLARAGAYGRGHGVAGSSADVTLGGSLALERAVEWSLRDDDGGLSVEQRQLVANALGRMTARVAGAWAVAIAGRATVRR